MVYHVATSYFIRFNFYVWFYRHSKCSSHQRPRHFSRARFEIQKTHFGYYKSVKSKICVNISVIFIDNLNNLLRAYKTYVRPLMEYASSIWTSSLITQIMALEATQKKITKHLPSLSILKYSDRLTTLKLQSLEHRRLITDLILCYKIIHKNTSIPFSDFFKFSYKTSPRSHSLHLSIPKLKSNTNPPLHIESCQHGTPCLKTL